MLGLRIPALQVFKNAEFQCDLNQLEQRKRDVDYYGLGIKH